MLVDKKYVSVRFNEDRLRERNRPLSILLDISTILASSIDLKDMLPRALARILEFFDLEVGRIYLMDKGRQSLSLAAHQGVDVEGLERVGISEGFSGKAARTKSFIAQYVSELEDRERGALLSRKGIMVVVCVPLLAAGEVVGVMNLGTARIIDIDEDMMDLLISIGNQIAIAVNNAVLYGELNNKMKELKAEKDATEFLAYSISHDLKSPAVGIFGLTRRLHERHRDQLDETAREYCRQILRASEQIVHMVDRINMYIMSKEAPLHLERVDLKEIAEAVQTEFAEMLSKRCVEWCVAKDMPTIVADRMSITRVLRNLVDNALKYGGEGLSRIEIECRENGEFHYVLVNDNGVALDEDEAERLFSLFNRSQASRGVEGAGLGLAIIKEIAERHKGGAWLEPGEGKGTTFCVAISKRLTSEE